MSRSSRLVAALLLALAACSRGGGGGGGAPLRVLAGSEIRDLEPLRARMEKAAGVPIELVYGGSLDAVERLEGGEAFDAVWLSHGKYLQLTPSMRGRIRASERIMSSPVVLGVKASKAKALGWDVREPTWAEIARAAADGKLTYGMTNPASSNTGFTALVGVASALADKADGLTVKDIKSAELRQLFAGQRLVAGSSGWLADAYLREQGRLDGLVNYESVILALDAGGKVQEPIVPIYPKEGIVTADYPLMLLAESRRPEYEKLVAWLRSVEAQREISTLTLRRPVNAAVEPAAAVPRRTLVELPFPGSREVLDALIDAYQGQLRRPASTYFVVDTSGSMEGDGIAQLRAALEALAGSDSTLTGRFARFQTREHVYLLPFTQVPGTPVRLALPADPAELAPIMGQIRAFAESLQAGGGTAIFSSVKEALEAARRDRAREPDRQYSVVVMTDGKNESGMTEEAFRGWYAGQRAQLSGIPVFGLLFGEAQRDQLEALGALTGGRVFDARTGLKAAFKEIRGYQ